jgi:SagB-type dehydrogenase family enzyme
VALRDVAGVAPGVWHYDARSHALQALREGAPDAVLLPPGARAAVWATAVFRRSGHKYGDRTYRYVLADLGHALENLRVAAGAFGAAPRLQPRFDEARVAAALGVDEAEEGVLALVLLQSPEASETGLAQVAARSSVPTPSPGDSAWRPAAAGPETGAPLGITDAVHRATSLRWPAAAAANAPTVQPGTPPRPDVLAPLQWLRLPAPRRAEADALAVIAKRRSKRRFSAAPLSVDELSAVLAAMAGPAPQLSPAVRIDVVTHAVQGLAMGAWRYDAPNHALRLRVRHDANQVRRLSGAAALDQDVIGDAAAVFVLAVDRTDVNADPAGPARGYRHAFLEAGLLGERLYLEAGARGLGVCAVGAFYDDEAAALTGVDTSREWIVHFAALGRVG